MFLHFLGSRRSRTLRKVSRENVMEIPISNVIFHEINDYQQRLSQLFWLILKKNTISTWLNHRESNVSINQQVHHGKCLLSCQ